MLSWLLLASAIAADCAPDDGVFSALQALLLGDDAAARTSLDAAERAYACSGPAAPDTLARMWILDGALLQREGDLEAAGDSYAAAARVAPGVWLPDLGSELHDAYVSAEAPPELGSLELTPAPGQRQVWVDGRPLLKPELGAGLHLVQVGGPEGEQAEFAEIVWVGPGVAKLVETGLETVAPPAELEPEPAVVGAAPRTPSEPSALAWHVALGASTALGTELANAGQVEPAVKLAFPVEASLGLRLGSGWVRGQAGIAGLVGGQYLSRLSNGNTLAVPIRVELAGAGGVAVDTLHFGALAGVHWPSRLAGRLVGGWRAPSGPWLAELRLGADLPTERSPEPAVELVFGVGG